MSKECEEYNKKIHDEIYKRNYKKYIELKKWLGIDDSNIENKQNSIRE